MTVEECLQKAAQAERLAAVVSFGKDRDILLRQADEWRERAAKLAGAKPREG